MEENRLFIQTELCSSNLQQEIFKSAPFEEARRFKLLREISLALKLVHANNMVHLDIKVRICVCFIRMTLIIVIIFPVDSHQAFSLLFMRRSLKTFL